MHRGARFGKVSLLLGGIALALALAAWHAESFRGIGSAYLLNWLEGHGLVRSPQPNGVPELVNPSPLLLTDQIAILWLLANSLWLSACSMLLALWAEFRREDTRYSSSGFICGALALLLFSYPLSMLAMGVGALVLFMLRYTKTGPNPSIEGTRSSRLRLPPRAPHVKR